MSFLWGLIDIFGWLMNRAFWQKELAVVSRLLENMIENIGAVQIKYKDVRPYPPN